MPQVKVVYIGGAGRSGSTLLERQLSESSDCVCAGELRWIWDRGVRRNQLCSCGCAFRECRQWNQVFAEAFGGMSESHADQMHARQRTLERFRYIPALTFRSLRGKAFQARLDAHGVELSKLYAAIARVTGRDVVVDNSKGATYAYLLAALPEIELRLLHLVRDSRAVAFSWSRKRLRPEVHDRVEYMPIFSAKRACFIWLRANVLMDLLRSRLDSATLLRYEDYVGDEEALVRSCAHLGISPPPTGADAAETVPQWHTVSGNPIRFDRQRSTVTADDEWREQMGMRALRTVTLLTAPSLRRYGYTWRRRVGSRGTRA